MASFYDDQSAKFIYLVLRTNTTNIFPGGVFALSGSTTTYGVWCIVDGRLLAANANICAFFFILAKFFTCSVKNAVVV